MYVGVCVCVYVCVYVSVRVRMLVRLFEYMSCVLPANKIRMFKYIRLDLYI